MSTPYTIDGVEDESQDMAQTTAQEWLDELVVLSFRENRRGGDPIAHTTDGRAVFPDKFQGGDEIRAGDHWVCSVSQKGESTFFAAPVFRLDAEFVTNLPAEERRRLAAIAVEDYTEFFHEELKEFQAPLGDSDTEAVVRERDELRERLMEINEQYDEAVARLGEAESRLAALRNGGSHEPSEAQEAATLQRDERYVVTREADDVLYCEAIPTGHYHGHISPNRRRLFIKSYGRGPLPCEDGRIQVPGLSRLIPDDVEELEARFDPRHGGFFVEIPR
jgi:hypothetical protein